MEFLFWLIFLFASAYVIRKGWNAAAPKPPPSAEERESKAMELKIVLWILGPIAALLLAIFAIGGGQQ